MASLTFSPSVANVKRLQQNLRQYAKALRDDVKVDIEQAVCASAAQDIVANIAGIEDVEGNYLGTDNPNAAVDVVPGLKGHSARWIGKQIAYIEFGAGAPAAGSVVDPETMAKAGYSPDPTKTRWVYRDAKAAAEAPPRVSHGWAPHAVMYNAAKALRLRGVRMIAAPILKKAGQDALTL